MKTKIQLSESINIGGCKLIETNNSEQKNKYTLETLDSFQFDKIDLIKIDVEGHELNVLKSGKETILKYKPVILFECWDNESPHWNDIPNTSVELMNYIKSLGYQINKIDIDGNDNYEALPIFL
jgi:hypothetical protein